MRFARNNDAVRLAFALTLRAFLAFLVAFAIAGMCLFPDAARADDAHSKVASGNQVSAMKPLEYEGMTPIHGDQVKNGTYEIEAKSSSSFFRLYGATLTVKDGNMTADIVIRSSSYPLVYPGTGDEAAQAPANDYIAYDKETETFTIPVDALDEEIDLAAFSKRRTMWYDRKLMFYAASLPEGALLVDRPEYGPLVERSETADTTRDTEEEPEPVKLDMADGQYSIEVNMTGGSGRASVSSPTWLIVKDGEAYARLLWSSSYYDYMILDDTTYYNETDDGSNSTFTIPITVMDDEIDVIADTTAMGDPVEIEYHLTFYSDTVGSLDMIPQEAAIKVLWIAVIVIAVGGIANFVIKNRRKR